MKLYSRPLSPFASRCRIQIYAKNLARMQSLARSGETLLTSNVAEAVRDEFTVEALEETMVKGRASPVRVGRLTGSRSSLGTEEGGGI